MWIYRSHISDRSHKLLNWDSPLSRESTLPVCRGLRCRVQRRLLSLPVLRCQGQAMQHVKWFCFYYIQKFETNGKCSISAQMFHNRYRQPVFYPCTFSGKREEIPRISMPIFKKEVHTYRTYFTMLLLRLRVRSSVHVLWLWKMIDFLPLKSIVANSLHLCPCYSHFYHGNLLWMLHARSLLVLIFSASQTDPAHGNVCLSFSGKCSICPASLFPGSDYVG